MICPNCLHDFTPRVKKQRYCTIACQKATNRRAHVEAMRAQAEHRKESQYKPKRISADVQLSDDLAFPGVYALLSRWMPEKINQTKGI